MLGRRWDLVQDHETSERPQLKPRVREARDVGGILQVEPRHRLPLRRRQLPGKRGLPHLPRTQQRHDGELPQQQPNPAQVVLSDDLHH